MHNTVHIIIPKKINVSFIGDPNSPIRHADPFTIAAFVFSLIIILSKIEYISSSHL